MHRDERGTISIVTVFAIFVFTILLTMIRNVARHADDKLRMQNAADAAAYTGGVTIARGMNAIAFTNHLEAEIFALVAYMREGRDRNAEALVPPILDMWEEIGGVFERHGSAADYDKFHRLGAAIQQKVPLERRLVSAFGEMTYRHSELTLPVLEYILAGEFIPQFQRAVVRMTPQMAHLASAEIAARYGDDERISRQHGGLAPAARLWRTDGWCVCDVDEENPYTRTIPAVDPSPFGPDGTPLGSLYYQTARSQRQDLATHYLELWIQDWLGPYFAWDDQDRPGRQTAKMSQFINLWRIFTCAHLRTLLDEEYPHNNLPHVLRQTPLSDNDRHDREHTLIAVAYWPHLSEAFPGLFRNPIARDGSDAQAFAQVRLFIPQRRHLCCPWAWPRPVTVRQPDGTIVTRIEWVNNMENRPSHWDLINQKWTAKLVPATSPAVLPILQTQPPGLAWFRPPRLGDATMEHVSAVNTH